MEENNIVEYDIKWFCNEVRSIFFRNLAFCSEEQGISPLPISPTLDIYPISDYTENENFDKISKNFFHGEILHLTHNPSWTLCFPKSFDDYSSQYDDLAKVKVLRCVIKNNYDDEISLPESEAIMEFELKFSNLCPLNCSNLIHFDYIPLNSMFLVTSDSLITNIATKLLLDTYHQNQNQNQINVKKIESTTSIKSSTSSSTNNSTEFPEKIIDIDSMIKIDINDDANIEVPINISDRTETGDSETEIPPESLSVKIHPITPVMSTDNIKELKDRAEMCLKDIDIITTPTLNFLKLEEIDKLRVLAVEAERSLDEDKGNLEREKTALLDYSVLQVMVGNCTKLELKLKKLKEYCDVKKDELAKSQFLLEARQLRLLHELHSLYPIRQIQDSSSTTTATSSTSNIGGVYTIRGLDLPLDISTRDDEHISSVLGYIVHVLLLASKYLMIPLRFQLIFQASRSMVRDPITGNGVALPLYRTTRGGSEKDKLDRAIGWLMRDCEQLLRSRGITYDSKRELLFNISLLFECELCLSLSF